MGKIIWLASYPKSGNTWLRIVLSNYLRNSEQAVNINDLEKTPIAVARHLFDENIGVEASDLTDDEIACLRPRLYEQLAAECSDTLFMKVHDVFAYTPNGEPLFSKAATQGAIYLIRNPLDVAISLANHNSASIDQAITWMATPGMRSGQPRNSLPVQLPQFCLDWSGHVLSWLDEPDLAIQLLRYEDMKRQPFASFNAALAFAGFEVDEARLKRAIEHSSFANLQAQEQSHGFAEKPARAKSFFRKGESGNWRKELNAEQVARIIQDHGEVMCRFGYLDEFGNVMDQ